MKKQMKLLTCLTKPLVLFVLLFTLGVGESWADMYLAGTMNSWAQTDATKFVDNKIEVTLAAETTYEFKIVDSGKWRSFDGSFSNTSLNYVLDKENVDGYNISITTGEAGTYIFQYSWYDSKHHLSVYYPQSRLKKNTVLYFDGRNSTKAWGTYTWGARFFYKYYDSGGDHSSLDCTSAVEDYVHYTTVPNHDYLGQIQVERKDPNNMGGTRWNYAAVCCAYNRANSGQNCMAISDDNKGWDDNFTPIWTTYCPPISSVTMTDNGSTLYGGNGSAGTPYLIEAGDPIKVHVTEAVSAVNDGNMTVNYQFKDGASNIGSEGTTSSATKTSGSSGTTHTIIVEARNKYNGATGTLARCTLYYETKTVYTGLSVAKSGDDSKASAPTISQTWAIATNSVTVTATVPDGYYFTGWTSSNGSFGDATALSTTFTPTADNAVATATYALRWAISTSYDKWSTNDHIIGNISTSAGVTSGYVDITLPANTDYELKVFDKTNHWLGHTTSGVTLTYSNSGTKYAMAEGNYNLGFTTAGAGSYRFTWDITNSKVSVTYPTSYYVTAAGNPAAGGTVTPSSATYMSTSVGGEITATPNYSHYFNGWTSNAGGTFTDNTAATTTFKPAADATVTAAFAERTAFIEGNFQVYNSDRSVRTKTGNAWQDASTTIKMTYDAGNNRYYLHTYSTPTELRDQLNDAGAFFYVKTSTSSSSIADAATYKACNGAAQSLSEYGSSHSLLVTTGESEHGFKFTGSEDGYVIIYFNGTSVWYELECALSYYGGEGATGDAPAERTYYAYNSNQTAASNSYSKTGYTFDHWDTAADDSGSDYAAGATNVAMNAHEVCLHAQWTAKEYTINLANMEATTAGTESVTVTYDASTNMTASDPITQPAKTNYDFAGYWTSENTGATLDHQLIGADGKWIKDVEGYTSHDGSGNPTWVHDYAISLYAKWTEHEYAVTLAISPAGAGTTSPASSTTAKYVTASGDIEATANTGYTFRDWDFSMTDAVNDIYCADTYTSTSNPVHIHAVHDGTLTANFTPNTYTVSFENLSADAGHKGSLDTTVTFNDTIHMKGRIEVPSKTNYDFGGYYTSDDEGETLGTQLIDENGNWKKGISGYTGTKEDVASWVYADDITLYAKWTETSYTITPSVSPAGAGSVNTVTDAHLVTPSSDITATPTNTVWVFDHWTCGTNVGIAGGKGTGDNPVTVTASQNSTITAYFTHRYNLLGSKYEQGKDRAEMTSGGMPGWTYGSGADFTINSYTADGDNATVDLSYTCTLDAGTYIFEIHDRKKGESLGRKADGGGIYELADWGSVELHGGADKDKSIFFYPQHAGQYTFRITYMTKDGEYYYPTVTIERPHQMHFAHKRVDIDGNDYNDDLGGTLTATINGESAAHEQWFDYGSDVVWTATAEIGYSLTWYTDNAYSNAMKPQPEASWNDPYITHDENIFAKFTETPTTVTLSNDGHGKIQIGGEDKTETTVGVTTTRSLTAVPNDGYKFGSWTKVTGEDITLSSTSTNQTTLTGNGAGETDGQEVQANFTYRWALKAESGNWGSEEFIMDAVSDGVCSKAITLSYANTNYEFKIIDLLTSSAYQVGGGEVLYMNHDNCTNWELGTDGDRSNCGITTAGKGMYRFSWNPSTHKLSVTYPAAQLISCGAATENGGSGGSITAIKDEANNDYSNGQYISEGNTITFTATPNDGYEFVGWFSNNKYNAVPVTNVNPWNFTVVSEPVNVYALFAETNVYYFDGNNGTNTDWTTPTNWTRKVVPTTSSHTVRILKPVTVSTGTKVHVANVDIVTGGSFIPAGGSALTASGQLNIADGGMLIVAGSVKKVADASAMSTKTPTDYDDLNIGSTLANGNGALVIGSHDGTNKAHVAFATKARKDNDGHNVNQFIGTPFNDENYIFYNYYGTKIYEFKAARDGNKGTNNEWQRLPNDGDMTPFWGYNILTSQTTSPTLWMQGTLNSSANHTANLYYKTGDTQTENMLANSWVSPIDITKFQISDFSANVEQTIYIYNAGTVADEKTAGEGVADASSPGQWIVLPINSMPWTSPTVTVIPSMQAFSVYVTAASQTLTMDYNRLVYNPAVNGTATIVPNRAPRRYTEEEAPSVLKIRVSGESGYSDQIVLLSREDFTSGYDNGWDGRKIMGDDAAPQLYTITQDGKMSIDCTPLIEGTLVGFKPGEADPFYTIRFDYDGDETLYLNDLQMQLSTPIDAEHTYSFSAYANDAESRFVISATPISQTATGIDRTETVSELRKLIIHDHLYIIRQGRIYTAHGQLVK